MYLPRLNLFSYFFPPILVIHVAIKDDRWAVLVGCVYLARARALLDAARRARWIERMSVLEKRSALCTIEGGSKQHEVSRWQPAQKDEPTSERIKRQVGERMKTKLDRDREDGRDNIPTNRE